MANPNSKNKMKLIYLILAAFLLGVILTVFSYQAFTIYQLRALVANDHATLTQVVDFLNQNIQQAQKGTTAQTQTQAQQAATATKK